jgi:hypothetical protein
MRLHGVAAAIAFACASAAAAQTPAVGAGLPRAREPKLARPEASPSPLRELIEQSPNRLVVVRHAPQAPIPLQGGGALEVESISAFEPGYEQQRLFGIRVTVNRPDLPEHERRFYLEPRDVDPLARAIDALEEVAASAQNPTEAAFFLPEGFGVGIRSVGGRVERVVRASRGELRHFALPADGLMRVRDALEAARRGIFGR